MTDHHVYQIGFTQDAVLTVNGVEFDGSHANPDTALDWALEQVAGAHRVLPEGTPLRVELLDDQRPGGYGSTGVVVPYGVVLTGDMLRDHLGVTSTNDDAAVADAPVNEPVGEPVGPAVDTDPEPPGPVATPGPARAEQPRTAPTGAHEQRSPYPARKQQQYEVSFEPLYPARPVPAADRHLPSVTAWVPVFARDTERLPYSPKEPNPTLTYDPRKDRKRRAPLSGRAKGLIGAGLALVLGVGVYAAMQDKPEPYAQVCVNNLSYQRLADARCENPTDQTSRWLYIKPGVAVPAVGSFTGESAGSFTAPTDSKATVDRAIPTNGRSASPTSGR